MTRSSILPLLLLAGCSAEVGNDDAALANSGKTLVVENVLIVQNQVAPVENGIVSQTPVPATAAEPAPPAAATPAAKVAPAQPKPEVTRAPDPKPAAKAKPKPEPKSAEVEPKPPVSTCTPEHREMGHC